MRLIDADELIKRINEIYEGYMTDESGCVPYDFERIVDEQPTAYDIDKVVEEFKNQMPFCPTNSFTEGAESALLDAIEIVKQGVR